jgi:DNA-binding response OmpR family regulator
MPNMGTAVVIEDDLDIGRLIHAILDTTGLDVRLAETGASGVTAVREHSPNIVLLDFGLPDISGLEVIGKIRGFSDVYILMLTGHEELSESLLAAGANAVMIKPFHPRDLKAHVEEALRGLNTKL